GSGLPERVRGRRAGALDAPCPREDAVAGDRPEDFRCRAQGAGERPRDLRDADAASVGDGDLGDAEARAKRLDLHLAGPAEALVAHAEAAVGLPPDRAERPEVRVAVAVE